MKKHIKLRVVTMALIMSITFLVSCEKNKNNEPKNEISQEKVEEVWSDILIYNLSTDQKVLDPTYSSTIDNYTMLVNLFEGLTRLDEFDKPEPAVAESWEVSEDGLTYTFHIRENAKWSDEKPVVAGDFYYAWLRALNPAVEAEKVNLFFSIKNAEEFYYGKEVEVAGKFKVPTKEDVGIKVIDDYTIEITLKYPTPYFLNLCALPIFFPIREDVVASDPKGWASSLKSFVNNGRYVVTEWNPEINVMLVKNDNHWDQKNTKLKNIDIKIEKDYNVGFNSFNIGIADVQDKVPTEELEKGLEEGTVRSYGYAGTYFYKFNLNEEGESSVNEDVAKVIQDVRVREALSLAIDRDQISSKMGSSEQAQRIVPNSMLESNLNKIDVTQDIAKAKKLLANAGFPGGNNFPTISISSNLDYGNEQIAKDIKAMWKENLGIDVEIKISENTVYNSQINEGDYIIAGDSVVSEYMDPLCFLETWSTGFSKENGGFSSEEYDKYIKRAREELDDNVREELLKRAENILIKNYIVLPIYHYSNHKAVKSYVSGMQVSSLGFVYFDKVVISSNI